ncbi:MAG: hypothetical protein HKO85_04665 [Xanthomonadales bacterium]|nr:hypothetical protein [Xanthomonadales bacterium]
MGVINAVSNSLASRVFRVVLLGLLLSPYAVMGSQDIADELGVPGTRQLAAALADPGSRVDTLLTMAVVLNLSDYGRYARLDQVAAYTARFGDERAWLDKLADRYGTVPFRSSLLDPSAWLLLVELDQYDLSPGPAVSPFGPGTRGLLANLFDRSNAVKAATVLPEVLSRLEVRSTVIWEELLRAAAENAGLAAVLSSLNEEWFDPWAAAEPPAPTGLERQEYVAEALALLRDGALMAQHAGPPDELDLKRVRFGLLDAMPGLSWQESDDAVYLLKIADAVEGLYREHYLAFTEALLWVSAGLLASEVPHIIEAEEEAEPSPFSPPPEIVLELLPGEPVKPPPIEPYRSPVPAALAEVLPALASAFTRDLERVDPRLNEVLAVAFDAVQYIDSGLGDPDQLASLRYTIADSVAQLVLLIPDMDYYFSQPVRLDIANKINICISRASRRNPGGSPALEQEEFDDCLEDLVVMASTLVDSAELAGDLDGPFAMEQLRRELELPPWQRINYVMGYLLERYDTSCSPPEEALPNPLEWSSLVAVITWFARQSPVHFRQPRNEALVANLRQQGLDLLEELNRQVDCIGGAGAGVNDPVARGLSDYAEALDMLIANVREEELAFRTERLQAGADVVLNGGAGQRTAYRPEDLAIGPCNPENVCEMTAELAAGPELLALFPDPYLLADQSGLGTVRICYDKVQWVDRRSKRVREDDPHVANYHGRLSFKLLGVYTEAEETSTVFGFDFLSPEEYHYLFGPATDEVLNDGCPTEWVGTKIVTPLGNRQPIRVVPDRLTYLAGARTLPTAVMVKNWERNQSWRSALVRGQLGQRIPIEPDEGFEARLEQHLQALYQSKRSAVYSALLNPPPRSWRGGDSSLHGQLRELSAYKKLVQAHVNLFYPLTLLDSEEIRGLLEGSEALLDQEVMRRMRGQGVSVSEVSALGQARLGSFAAAWSRRPEVVRRSGSAAVGLVHAIVRLESLYRDFFAPRPQPPPKAVGPDDVIDFEALSG